MKTKSLITFLCLLLGMQFADAQDNKVIPYDELAKPVVNGIWLQPAQGVDAQCTWGFKDGINIKLHRGARGNISIYAPYLNIPDTYIIQYFALEPIKKGNGIKRSYSELEFSDLDGKRGMHLWSSNTPDYIPYNGDYRPASGVIGMENGKQTLTVYIFCEKFKSGADVYMKAKFTEGEPYQVEVTPCISKGSAELDYFVITATMGNRARIRELHLNGGKVLKAGDIWPDYKGLEFADDYYIPEKELITDSKGGKWFVAYPDEKHPEKGIVPESHRKGWTYTGKVATQYWYAPNPSDKIQGKVNGRRTYWSYKVKGAEIPGGIAYENFELFEPYFPGQTFVFGISPLPVDKFIKKVIKRK